MEVRIHVNFTNPEAPNPFGATPIQPVESATQRSSVSEMRGLRRVGSFILRDHGHLKEEAEATCVPLAESSEAPDTHEAPASFGRTLPAGQDSMVDTVMHPALTPQVLDAIRGGQPIWSDLQARMVTMNTPIRGNAKASNPEAESVPTPEKVSIPEPVRAIRTFKDLTRELTGKTGTITGENR